MADHLVDIYDENMTPIGTALKSEAHKTGAWHASIHCWIINPADGGSVLFQKRASDKDLFPDALDISAAGHYVAGEAVEDGVREILEELGVSAHFDDLIPLGVKIDLAKQPGVLNHEFCHTFAWLNDTAVDAYDLGVDEVEGLVKISIADGLDLFAERSVSAEAVGVEYNKVTHSWDDVHVDVTLDDFIPRVDSYYYKVFITAERLLAGSFDVAI